MTGAILQYYEIINLLGLFYLRFMYCYLQLDHKIFENNHSLKSE
jgi:hypothetical protein